MNPAPKPVSVLHLAAADIMLFPILRDQLCYLRDTGLDIHTASIDGPLGRRIQEDGFPWTPLPLTREMSLLSDWRALRVIERFCREKRFTIVHTHTPKGNVIGQWAARRAGVPIVLQTLHGFYFHERMGWLERRKWILVERFSARHSDHILCQNPEDVETAARERIAAPGQITLLGNGIDLARFKPAPPGDPRRVTKRQELRISPEALVVGMVGRFVAEKGFPEFLAAAERILAHAGGASVHFLAVGHKLASERAGEAWAPPTSGVLSGKLTVLEDRDDMPDLYACMDIHVLPSHREGFPRALMEGAASGLPQVATNIRGCRQTVEEGKTGFLIGVGAVGALADRIGRLMSDAGLRAAFGRAARAKAEAEFDQRRVFEKVRACYDELLLRKRVK
ncbi:MAG: glycosyltransferase family 4 protein [Planctomycetota bacterium]|nr:glycosyltransferase family 4 protein [Planctomycetota bacterium]